MYRKHNNNNNVYKSDDNVYAASNNSKKTKNPRRYPFHGAQPVIDSDLYAVRKFFRRAFVGLQKIIKPDPPILRKRNGKFDLRVNANETAVLYTFVI